MPTYRHNKVQCTTKQKRLKCQPAMTTQIEDLQFSMHHMSHLYRIPAAVYSLEHHEIQVLVFG